MDCFIIQYWKKKKNSAKYFKWVLTDWLVAAVVLTMFIYVTWKSKFITIVVQWMRLSTTTMHLFEEGLTDKVPFIFIFSSVKDKAPYATFIKDK